MRHRDDERARIRHAGCSRFRYQSDVVTRKERCDHFPQSVAVRLIVQFQNGQFKQGSVETDFFQKSPRGFGIFGDVVIESQCGRNDGSRQDLRWHKRV